MGINMNNEKLTLALNLCVGNFKFVAYHKSNKRLLLCEAYNKNKVFNNIGRISESKLLLQLNKILNNNHGKKIDLTQEKPSWYNLLGKQTIESLGYFVLSGYNTFGFYRESSGLEHIVLVNSNGKLITHWSLEAKSFKKLQDSISQQMK